MNRRIATACLLMLAACRPAVSPLTGARTDAKLPPTPLPSRPMQLRFTWSYADDSFKASGDGVVRVLAPERARLDFFLGNGSAGGYAILVGDTITAPGGALTQFFLPPTPMLWSALGHLRLPATRDTTARLDGDTLRVDLGTLSGDATRSKGEAWRVVFAGTRLTRTEHIEGGKRVEWMMRERVGTNEQVRYLHETARRRLTITVTDTMWMEGFDDAIWRR